MPVLLKSILSAVLFGGLILAAPAFAQKPNTTTNYVNLNVVNFQKELAAQKGVVLDVRTPTEFAQGHLPHAINMNYQDPEFEQAIKNLKPNQPYFIYCAKGGRSAKACDQLKANNLKKVYNLEGGIAAWQQAGQVIVK
ncbi:rhodanese-like domain-containing protein [Adhaeribacter pallidiroseus]|uniref:Rhodanese domain-containing protein n=1 Tax=Adhaeribacter pallidiroseus TaxID=2072847 RepID=A0A369QBF1_9BACT|nr:rhodanese-like domain-containing protein [Adhaeribacter pallidiroseus]RDC61660.1 hypothetical protein AHMF7616_00240 [Adhaeribacter pallidiroseus]